MTPLIQMTVPNDPVGPSIYVSPRAQEELRRAGVDGQTFLRIGVRNGGCAGWTYSAALDQELTSDDQVVFAAEGVRIVTDRQDVPHLARLQIDFSEDLVTSGFRLTNTAAAHACGCGASFAR